MASRSYKYNGNYRRPIQTTEIKNKQIKENAQLIENLRKCHKWSMQNVIKYT